MKHLKLFTEEIKIKDYSSPNNPMNNIKNNIEQCMKSSHQLVIDMISTIDKRFSEITTLDPADFVYKRDIVTIYFDYDTLKRIGIQSNDEIINIDDKIREKFGNRSDCLFYTGYFEIKIYF